MIRKSIAIYNLIRATTLQKSHYLQLFNLHLVIKANNNLKLALIRILW